MPRLFVSYHQDDHPLLAEQLCEYLEGSFGPRNVVRPFTVSITEGEAPLAPDALRARVGQCDILLAIIGPEWLALTNSDDSRRLDDPDDPVTIALESALSRPRFLVVPVMLAGAIMPPTDQIPPSLRALATKSRATVRAGATFNADMDLLVEQINKLVAGQISGVRTLVIDEGPPGTKPGEQAGVGGKLRRLWSSLTGKSGENE